MIRINLLPQKRGVQRRAEGSQLWLGLVLFSVLLEVAGLFVFHSMKLSELKAQQRKDAEVSSEIDQSKRNVANHAEIKTKLERFRAREDAIAKLQSARTGPTAVLLELARLLTSGRGPSVTPDRLNQVKRENPLALYNPAWDARRLWLTSFVE
ncbi:MAG TPA: hypothetical protein VGJ84_08085, partial [Polyangiaceae bacterium]